MERSRIIEVVNKCPKPKLGEKKSSSILSLTNFCPQATAVNRRVPWIYNWKEISGSVEKCSLANQKVISLFLVMQPEILQPYQPYRERTHPKNLRRWQFSSGLINRMAWIRIFVWEVGESIFFSYQDFIFQYDICSFFRASLFTFFLKA
jgi:hypothetical protein